MSGSSTPSSSRTSDPSTPSSGPTSEFRDALQARLARNREIEEERDEAEREMRRRQREKEEAERRQKEEQRQARDTRHAELVGHLQDLIAQLEESAPENVVARTGWTESGEEFIAKLSSVQLIPRRSLLVELDRDDDEVLARWASAVGDSVELWRLTGFDTDMLTELVLGVIDDELWRGRTSPPEFPGVEY